MRWRFHIYSIFKELKQSTLGLTLASNVDNECVDDEDRARGSVSN